MNDEKATTPGVGLIVVGASGRIGREVARLGVAYGAEVYGVCLDGVPPTDEPWTQGVTWLARDVTQLGALDDLRICAVVVAAPIALPAATMDRFDRVVYVLREGMAAIASADSVIVATPGEVDDSPLRLDVVTDDRPTLRVETVGMALLRAALDEEMPATLGPEEIAYYGDAVMLQ